MRVERVYASEGRQRPVFLAAGEGVRFALEMPPDAVARVLVTHDPVESVRLGRALWEPFAGGSAGELRGFSAYRVFVEALGEGWVTLVEVGR